MFVVPLRPHDAQPIGDLGRSGPTLAVRHVAAADQRSHGTWPRLRLLWRSTAVQARG